MTTRYLAIEEFKADAYAEEPVPDDLVVLAGSSGAARPLSREVADAFALELSDDELQRTRLVTASDESEDSYLDVIRVAGWDLSRYRKNPVILWAHDRRALPLGQALKTYKDPGAGKTGPRLRQIVKFASGEANPLAEFVLRSIDEGSLRGASVGFRPIKWKARTNQAGEQIGTEYTKQLLLENSVVPLPANPNGLFGHKSIDDAPLRAFVTKALDGESDAVQVPGMQDWLLKAHGVITGQRSTFGVGSKPKAPSVGFDHLLTDDDDAPGKSVSDLIETLTRQIERTDEVLRRVDDVLSIVEERNLDGDDNDTAITDRGDDDPIIVIG